MTDRLVARLRAVGCVFAEDEAAEIRRVHGDDETAADAVVAARKAGIPLEQALGVARFAGVEVEVGEGVFVPRLRAEPLVDDAVAAAPDARIVVIAHRRELIYQPIRRAEAMYPHLALKMGVVMASRRDCSAQIIIATVQSLVSGNCQRVKEIVQFGDIDYLICDESHRLVASTYLKVLEAMGEPKMLGCTATPKRTDNVGLGTVLKKLSYRYSIQQAIREGALVPFNALGFTLPFEAQAQDLEPGEEGEPEDQSLGQLLSADNILEIVFEKWSELAANRKTIGFTASVAQAHATAAYFCSRGIKAEAIVKSRRS